MDGAADVYEVFDSFDSDMSGFLDKDELTKALQTVLKNERERKQNIRP